MDGKGRFLDNIFVEQLWRNLTYECVYLHARETGPPAPADIRKWKELSNGTKPHSADGDKPPAMNYRQAIAKYQPDQQAQTSLP